MKDKIKFLQSFFDRWPDGGAKLLFDYVSADMKISFGKEVKPVEIRPPYLWAEDLSAKNAIKRYLIDGIQKPVIKTDEGQLIEFIEQ